MDPAHPTRSVGRPASATRDQVLLAATRQFRAGDRLDLTAVAAELGLSRATLYRWFGSREDLISAVLSAEFQLAFTVARDRARGSSGTRVLDTLRHIQILVTESYGLRCLLQRESAVGLRILTSGGSFQQGVVERVHQLIEDESRSSGFRPPIEPATLAYALVRLAEAFIYNDTTVGAAGDLDRLLEVERVLLGLRVG